MDISAFVENDDELVKYQWKLCLSPTCWIDNSAVTSRFHNENDWSDYIKYLNDNNEDYFLKEEPTKIYYTGKTKTFPSTVSINKLYYFMPYIKEKGVRDLYLIRVARIGNKAEILPESNDEEPRLVFELEYLESLPEYKMISLTKYWYKDTLLGMIMNK